MLEYLVKYTYTLRFQKPQGGELYVDEDASEEDAFSKKIHGTEVAALVIAYLPKHHVTSLASHSRLRPSAST